MVYELYVPPQSCSKKEMSRNENKESEGEKKNQKNELDSKLATERNCPLLVQGD